MLIGLHNGQRARTDEGSAARDPTTRRNIAVYENLETRGDEGCISASLTEELQGSDETCLEVIDPLVFGWVDLDILILRDRELTRGELFRIHVGDLEHCLRTVRRNDLDGDDDVDTDGRGQDIVEVVVDMFSDDVHTTRAPSHEIGSLTIGFGELGYQAVEARLVLWGNCLGRGIVGCVDLSNRFRLRDKFLRGHGGVAILEYEDGNGGNEE